MISQIVGHFNATFMYGQTWKVKSGKHLVRIHLLKLPSWENVKLIFVYFYITFLMLHWGLLFDNPDFLMTECDFNCNFVLVFIDILAISIINHK